MTASIEPSPIILSWFFIFLFCFYFCVFFTLLLFYSTLGVFSNFCRLLVSLFKHIIIFHNYISSRLNSSGCHCLKFNHNSSDHHTTSETFLLLHVTGFGHWPVTVRVGFMGLNPVILAPGTHCGTVFRTVASQQELCSIPPSGWDVWSLHALPKTYSSSCFHDRALT